MQQKIFIKVRLVTKREIYGENWECFNSAGSDHVANKEAAKFIRNTNMNMNKKY